MPNPPCPAHRYPEGRNGDWVAPERGAGLVESEASRMGYPQGVAGKTAGKVTVDLARSVWNIEEGVCAFGGARLPVSGVKPQVSEGKLW